MMDGQRQDRGLVARVGPMDVDVPRSIGYFGAIGLAVAFEVIEWPVGLFIASIPFVKMFNRPKLPQPVRFVEHVLDGMAKPVGGDSEGTIRTANQGTSSEPPGAGRAEAKPESGNPRRRAPHAAQPSARRPAARARRSGRKQRP